MEIVRFPSYRGLSVRSIFTFVLAVILTTLLGVLALSSPTHAADAAWNGANLDYGNRQFYLAGTTKENEIPGIPANSRYYLEASQPQVAPDSSTAKATIIYLKPGTDPPGDGTATLAEYDFNPVTKKYTNPANVKSITVDTASIDRQVTTCSIPGIGWIVCPVVNFLAWGMDTIFAIIAQFMEVQPLQLNNQDNALYNAWNIVRGIANIAFVIGFLIIIYSQLTGIGLSNYGLKRLLPRLIIAAIAINLSYIIVAIGVDLSNILGWSINDMFVSLRNTLLSTSALNSQNLASLLSWESVAGFVLSGGTAVGAGAIGLVAIAGSSTAAIFLLLPALVGLLVGVLVVLLILAARQALIIILAIIAPLAIVAYLLPNTEKWFGKWRDLLMTMLIFFPAFAVVFGGSQLAGAVIIQNADSINLLILGMIVQVAPLVITPLLLKLSGSVLGGIARLVNDPNRGIIDRTRKWSGERANWQVNRKKANLDRRGNPRLDANGQPKPMRPGIAKTSRYFDQRSRRLKDRVANAESALQTGYEESGRHTAYDRNGNLKYDMSQQKAYFEARKEATHSHHAAHVDEARRTQGSMLYGAAMKAEQQKDYATASKNYTEAFYNNARRDQKIAEGALHASGYKVELSKDKLTRTENLKQTYYDNQRAERGTDLFATAVQLETSKFKAETAKNTFTASMDEYKVLKPNSKLSVAAQYAQSSKEHLDGAQQELAAFFDRQRATVGSELNISSMRLEESKTVAERAKSQLTEFVSNERSTIGTSLHNQTVLAEKAKQKQQIAETKLTRIIEEYKAGGAKNDAGETLINDQVVDVARATIVEEMLTNTVDMAAETQGNQAAKNVQTRRIAEAFTETYIDADGKKVATQRANDLTTIAGSVDPDGITRAQASMTATLSKLQQQSLDDNKVLIQYEARQDPRGIKAVDLAKELITMASSTDPAERSKVSQSQLEAAFEMRIDDGQTLDFEDARANMNIDQSMLDRVIERNRGAFKGKGGFHIQQDLGLSLQRYYEKFDAGDLEYYDLETHSMKPVTDRSQVEDVFKTDMKRARLNTFGAANADGLGSIKFGTFENTAKNLTDLLSVMDTTGTGKQAEADQRSIRGMHGALRNALSDSSIRASMNDRKEEAVKMERILSEQLGMPPLDPKVYNEGVEDIPDPDNPAPTSIDPEEGSPSEASNDS